MFEGFAEKSYIPRMKTMNKPAYRAIMSYSRNEPVIIYVSSKRQVKQTATDILALCGTEQQQLGNIFGRPFLHIDHVEAEIIAEELEDESLKHTIQYGIGMLHTGLQEKERKLVEKLFQSGKI